MKSRHWRLALVVGTIYLAPAGAQAAVALAIGVTGDPNDGLAAGRSYNFKTEQEAARTAIKSCREFKTALKASRNCRLIGTLPKGCIGVAFDPKTDSTGMGWAVAEKREDARSRAMENCRIAAPRDRAQFCEIDFLKCDGDAALPKK
jgi:hypothetical protein